MYPPLLYILVCKIKTRPTSIHLCQCPALSEAQTVSNIPKSRAEIKDLIRDININAIPYINTVTKDMYLATKGRYKARSKNNKFKINPAIT